MDNAAPEQKPGFWSRVKQFFQSDRADSVLVTTIIGLPALLMISGFAMDTSKNAMVSSKHHSQAQVAAQSAVREINARGSLGIQAIETFHNNLEREFGVDLDDVDTAEGTCAVFEPLRGDGSDETFPRYSVQLVAENNYATGGGAPVTSGTFTYTAGEDFDEKLYEFAVNGGLDNNQVYKVVSADVHSSSVNIMMWMLGMPCQAYHSHVEAGAFNEFQ